jgi:ABC-type transport system substrate-binding protein
MKRIQIIVTFTVIMALFLSACSKKIENLSGNSPAVQEITTTAIDNYLPGPGIANVDYSKGDVTKGKNAAQKTKVVAACNTFESLAPFTTRGSNMNSIGYCIYEPLWTKELTGNEEVGVIAKEWKWTDDYTCDVTIYDYIYDVDNNHLTASDVVWSVKQWIEGGTNSQASYVKSVEKTGEYTVRIVFTIKAYPSFLTNLRCNIISEKAFMESPDKMVSRPVGTGHYRVTEFVNGSKVVMEQTYNHWQKDQSKVPAHLRAHADVVEYDVIIENSQMETALSTGMIQCAPLITATSSEDLYKQGRAKIVYAESAYGRGILLNVYPGSVLSDNLKLRQAILYAIDNASVASAVTYGTGYGAKAYGSPAYVGYQKKWDNEDFYDYNVEKAQALLKEAGYKPGELTLKWSSENIENQTLTGQVIQGCLAAIGINLQVQTYDQTTALRNRMGANLGNWDICFGDLSGTGYYVLCLRNPLDDTFEWGNQAGLRDARLQSLLYDAIYDMSPEKIDTLHQYVKELAVLYCTYVGYEFYGINQNIDQICLGPHSQIAANACVFNDNYDVYAR